MRAIRKPHSLRGHQVGLHARARLRPTHEPLRDAADVPIDGLRPRTMQVHDQPLWRRPARGGVCVNQSVGLDGDSSLAPCVYRHIATCNGIPSALRLAAAVNGCRHIEARHDFGPYCVHTLHAWHGNFRTGRPQGRDMFEPHLFRRWTSCLLRLAREVCGRGLGHWHHVRAPQTREAAHPRTFA